MFCEQPVLQGIREPPCQVGPRVLSFLVTVTPWLSNPETPPGRQSIRGHSQQSWQWPAHVHQTLTTRPALCIDQLSQASWQPPGGVTRIPSYWCANWSQRRKEDQSKIKEPGKGEAKTWTQTPGILGSWSYPVPRLDSEAFTRAIKEHQLHLRGGCSCS